MLEVPQPTRRQRRQFFAESKSASSIESLSTEVATASNSQSVRRPKIGPAGSASSLDLESVASETAPSSARHIGGVTVLTLRAELQTWANETLKNELEKVKNAIVAEVQGMSEMKDSIIAEIQSVAEMKNCIIAELQGMASNKMLKVSKPTPFEFFEMQRHASARMLPLLHSDSDHSSHTNATVARSLGGRTIRSKRKPQSNAVSREGTESRGLLDDDDDPTRTPRKRGSKARDRNREWTSGTAPGFEQTVSTDEEIGHIGPPGRLGLAGHRDSVYSQSASIERSILSSCVLHPYFDIASCTTILLNIIFIAVQTDYMARKWTMEIPSICKQIDAVFCVIFVIEIVMRILVQGAGYFCGAGAWRNFFDVVITLAQIAEIFYATGDKDDASLSLLRVFRVLRVLRMARIARIFHAIAELRMLVVSIISSLKGLLWTMLLIWMITLALGVAITQAITEHKVLMGAEYMHGGEDRQQLLHYFGTLQASMLTLYEAISNGVQWSTVVRPLADQCSQWWRGLFILYIGFVMFAMLNVITAFFVGAALQVAEEDERSTMLDSLWQFFSTTGDPETITEDEFYSHLESEEMQKYLSMVHLSSEEEARNTRLFELIDSDRSGSVDSDELARGCVKLCGPAKAIELAAFSNEMRDEVGGLKNQVSTIISILGDRLLPTFPSASE